MPTFAPGWDQTLDPGAQCNSPLLVEETQLPQPPPAATQNTQQQEAGISIWSQESQIGDVYVLIRDIALGQTPAPTVWL